jgi:chaperonin GroEL
MRIIKTGTESREAAKKGIDMAVNLAKATLGGKGRIVMIDTPQGIHWTLDGITVLAYTRMNDEAEDMGVKVVLEAANKQNMECDDGTTSVSVVLQALISGGMKNMAAGADPLLIKKGINMGAEAVVEELKRIAIPVNRDSEEIRQAATVSAHGDTEIGDLIYEAISKTGENSKIAVEASNWAKSIVEVTEGVKVGSGWLMPEFITNREKATAELENPLVLIYEGKIKDFKELAGTKENPGILFQASMADRPLLIISDQLEGEPLSTLIANKLQGGLKVAAINPFGFDRNDTKFRLQDLAIALGGKVVSPDLGHRLDEVRMEDLGRADKVIISKSDTLFINGKSDPEKMSERVNELKQLIADEQKDFEKSLYEGRLAAIDGGVGIVYIGGTTSGDVKEKKDRADDALGSALSSLEYGVVPGGGISLLLAKRVLNNLTTEDVDVNTGIRILAEAMEAPFKQIIKNAGGKVDVILNEVLNKDEGTGYNVITEEYVDMIEEGVLDPAKVEINVIRNATSVATRFLTSEGMITNKIDNEKSH